MVGGMSGWSAAPHASISYLSPLSGQVSDECSA